MRNQHDTVSGTPLRDAASGNTLAEYGIVIGSVAILAIGGLQLFGGGVSKMFSHSETQLASQPVQNYVHMQFSKTSGTGSSVNGSLGAPANDGLAMHGGSGFNTNATSLENSTAYVSSSTVQQINALAAKLKNPASKALAKRMSQILSGIALAEGLLEKIPEFTADPRQFLDEGNYKTANSYKDIYNGSNNVLSLLQDAEALNDPAMAPIVALAERALQKATPYYNNVQNCCAQAQKDSINLGQLAKNFGDLGERSTLPTGVVKDDYINRAAIEAVNNLMANNPTASGHETVQTSSEAAVASQVAGE